MSDYVAFADVVASLPQGSVEGSPSEAFRVVGSSQPFIEPMMSQYDVALAPRITLISARGATGKSVMAAELSIRRAAPLWSLSGDRAVSGDALTARLSAFLDVADPLAVTRSGGLPILIIDAMDEARLRVQTS